MARKLLSFLGTGDYPPGTYECPAGRKENVRFVQEALIALVCRQWTPGGPGAGLPDAGKPCQKLAG